MFEPHISQALAEVLDRSRADQVADWTQAIISEDRKETSDTANLPEDVQESLKAVLAEWEAEGE